MLCYSRFLCFTPILLFAAAEHRGLNEDEFPSQHLEACLMIIKKQDELLSKMTGGGAFCGLGLTLSSNAYTHSVTCSAVSEETPPETFKI